MKCSIQINWFGKYFLKTKMWCFCTLQLESSQQNNSLTSSLLCSSLLEIQMWRAFSVCVCACDFYTDHPLQPQVLQYLSSIHKFLSSALFLICTHFHSQWSISMVSVHKWMDIYHKSSAAIFTNHSSVWIAQILEDIKECCGNLISGAGFHALTG